MTIDELITYLESVASNHTDSGSCQIVITAGRPNRLLVYEPGGKTQIGAYDLPDRIAVPS